MARAEIEVRSFDDDLALQVMRNLDVNDALEVHMMRGRATSPLALWADWRAVNAFRAASIVAVARRRNRWVPFVVLGVAATGVPHIGQGAMLACNHVEFHDELVRFLLTVRQELPGFALNHKLNRIEARCWADHPSAANLLEAIGFKHEGDLDGFGEGGNVRLRQFAWINPNPITEPNE